MKPREDGGAQILDLGHAPGFHFACQKGQAVDFGRVAGNNRFELRSKAHRNSPAGKLAGSPMSAMRLREVGDPNLNLGHPAGCRCEKGGSGDSPFCLSEFSKVRLG